MMCVRITNLIVRFEHYKSYKKKNKIVEISDCGDVLQVSTLYLELV